VGRQAAEDAAGEIQRDVRPRRSRRLRHRVTQPCSCSYGQEKQNASSKQHHASAWTAPRHKGNASNTLRATAAVGKVAKRERGAASAEQGMEVDYRKSKAAAENPPPPPCAVAAADRAGWLGRQSGGAECDSASGVGVYAACCQDIYDFKIFCIMKSEI
jgi:hypothetical protein